MCGILRIYLVASATVICFKFDVYFWLNLVLHWPLALFFSFSFILLPAKKQIQISCNFEDPARDWGLQWLSLPSEPILTLLICLTISVDPNLRPHLMKSHLGLRNLQTWKVGIAVILGGVFTLKWTFLKPFSKPSLCN